MIILNEKEYAERCLKYGLVDRKPFLALNILSKYYYHHLGYRKKKIKELLMDFAERYCYEYFKSKLWWERVVDKFASNAGKHPLYEIDGVCISREELDTIWNLHSKVLERLSFTLLCLAKLDMKKNPKSDGWINYSSKEIFRLARIDGGIFKREAYLHELYKIGLIDFAKKIDNMAIKICFIEGDCEKESDGSLYITDFRELGYAYLRYRGFNYIPCQKCGILIKGNKAHTRKFCKDCATYTPLERKEIRCIDCGKLFTVTSTDNRSNRCSECYAIYRKRYKAEKEKERRERLKKEETKNE